MSAQTDHDDVRGPGPDDYESLVTDLKTLTKKGPRAVTSCTHLVAAFGIPDDAGPEVTWKAVEARLKLAATQLDPRLRLALIEGLGLRPGAPHGFGDRLKLIGTHEDRGGRTARRRVYKAFEAVAELTLADNVRPLVPTPDWLMMGTSVHADLRGDTPSVVMKRTILVIAPGISRVEESISAPRVRPDERVHVTTLEGCTSVDVEPTGNASFRVVTHLNRTVTYGTEHTFTISAQLPRLEAMTPMIGIYPTNSIREVKASVSFGRRRPSSIARFEGDIPVGTFMPVTQELDPALRHHECVFRDVEIGRGYGIRWTWD